MPKFAYFPFEGGPRTCIGNTFAEQEGRVVLGAICKRFQLQVPPGMKVTPYLGVTRLPRDNQLPLEVQRRDAAPSWLAAR